MYKTDARRVYDGEHAKADEIGQEILVEVTQDLATSVLPTGLVMVQHTGRGGQDNDTERTSGQQLFHPVFNPAQGYVETGRDDTALVDPAQELNDNLAAAVIINELVLANVA